MKKPIFSLFTGHDASVSIYDPNINECFVLKFETLFQEKHFEGMYDYGFREAYRDNYDEYKGTIKGYADISELKIKVNGEKISLVSFLEKTHYTIKKCWGYDNDYSTVILNNSSSSKGVVFSNLGCLANGETYVQNTVNYPHSTPLSRPTHHEKHAYSAYWQSPFANKKSAVLVYDGGGDWGAFAFYKIENNKIVETKMFPWNFGCLYSQYMHGYMRDVFPITTNPLDYAGKYMGHSAYGKRFEVTHPKQLQTTVDQFQKCHFFFSNEREFSRHLYPSYEIPLNAWFVYLREIKRHSENRVNQHFNMLSKVFPSDKDVAEYTTYAAQKSIEVSMSRIINELLLEDIRECDNRLVISGGCALNVLVNERIKTEHPEMQIYVPPNPADDGLSSGACFAEHTPVSTVKMRGPKLFDLDDLPRILRQVPNEKVDMKTLIEDLKNGKIIGLIQGECEIGPRALGFRSILCDPSYPDMKDTLNAKVKFREWYRPFAPACRYEDAPKYFNSVNFENMECMSFVAEVKEEYKEQLQSITHVDNTARLQTVTKESNPFFYDLLTEWDGVLLNTSFNVQGKPILNTLKDAIDILNKTQLDYVYYKADDETLYRLGVSG